MARVPRRSRHRRVGLLLAVFLDVLVDAVRETQVAVDVAVVRIIAMRADRELLLALPLHDPIAARRVVIAALHLLHERLRLALVATGALAQPIDAFLLAEEMPPNHHKHEPPVMPDVLPV